MTLWTASWSTLTEASVYSELWELPVQPVRVSRGVPRFWPAAEYFPVIEDLMTDPWMLGVWARNAEQGARCYRRKLHAMASSESAHRSTSWSSSTPSPWPSVL
jgi:hypothetical protein